MASGAMDKDKGWSGKFKGGKKDAGCRTQDAG
jgi:hypothetical protein